MVEGRNNRVPIKDTSRPGRWLTVSQGGESSYDEHTVTGGGGWQLDYYGKRTYRECIVTRRVVRRIPKQRE